MSTTTSIHRQWLLLQKLEASRWIGTVELQHKLLEEGVDVNLRTVQRDLVALQDKFPLEHSGGTPQGWRWQKGAPLMSLPDMTSGQALTFMMVEQHLKSLMPGSVLDELRPWFDNARSKVRDGDSNVHRWADKVRIVPATQPLIPPSIDAKVLHSVQEALLMEQRINSVYQSRSRKEALSLELNPLALVQRGPIIYLIATGKSLKTGQYTDEVRRYALHRFEQIEPIRQKSVRPKGFKLDSFLALGGMGFGQGKLVRLNIVLDHDKGEHLYESRLSEDQTITELADGRLQVEATVADTPQLRWWLQAMGIDHYKTVETQLSK